MDRVKTSVEAKRHTIQASMFQDINPHQFNCDFACRRPSEADYLILSTPEGVLFDLRGEAPCLPSFGSSPSLLAQADDAAVYLFSVDERAFFLSLQEIEPPEGFGYKSIPAIRTMQPPWLAFASATAFHLSQWYKTRRFCGRCAAPLAHHETQRALCCSECGLLEYPKISPAVIVAVIDGDRLLMTKYSKSIYKKYALVAGFVEIGETLEDAARREVMEEVGLEIGNLRYYKSQPWAFSQSVLMGFFADLQGDDTITLNTDELSEAAWFARDEIPVDDLPLSLTWDMIERFRRGAF